jgi:DNA-binding transcriptional MerR regulator
MSAGTVSAATASAATASPAAAAAAEVKASRSLRIGEVARIVGTTARTIRYYEEIGLLPDPGDRPAGQHRVYSEAEVERLQEIMRLRNLLGVTLDELKELVEAEEARAALRAELQRTDDAVRQREILTAAMAYIDRQLEMVRHRRNELTRLEQELTSRRRRARARLRQIASG